MENYTWDKLNVPQENIELACKIFSFINSSFDSTSITSQKAFHAMVTKLDSDDLQRILTLVMIKRK